MNLKESHFETNRNLINAILTNDRLSEEEKSDLIAQLLEEFKSEYPNLQYHATKQDVTETELRLIKEIENTRKEIKEVDAKLSKEIKELDAKLSKEIKELDAKLSKEIKELELKLTQEIENTRKEIKELDAKLSKEIKETKVEMIKWSFLFWISQIGVIATIGFTLYKNLSQ